MVAGINSRKQSLVSDLRKLAKQRAQNGVFNKADVQALLQRAKADGSVSKTEAVDLSFVREQYSGIMTKDAANALDGFLSNWISDQIAREARKQSKEKAREKKIEGQIEKIETEISHLQDWRAEVDQRMRSMNVDDKQRVIISSFFNLRQDD